MNLKLEKAQLFVFCFPDYVKVCRKRSGLLKRKKMKKPLNEKANEQKTILVVDDESSSLNLIDFVLQKNHYQTLLACKGEEALKLVEKKIPDLIILDYLMPTISGIEVCQLLKINPLTKNIPILFISAVVAHNNVEDGLRAGASAYLFKPFDPDKMIAKIEELIGGKI